MINVKQKSPLQTKGWSKVKESNGSEVLWIDDFWLSIKSAPGIGKFGYIPHLWAESHKLRSTEQQIADAAKQNGLGFVLIDPFLTDEPYDLQAPLSTVSGLKTIQLRQHMVMDLKKPDAELMSGMRSSHKRYLKKLIKNENTTVETGDSAEFIDRYLHVMKTATSADNYGHYPDKYYRDIINTSDSDLDTWVTIVSIDGEDVGANLIISTDKIAAELFIGLTARGRKDSAGLLLSWGAMMQAQENKAQQFVQWGVAPMDVEGNFDHDHSLYGISEFKRRFGGEYLRLSTQRVIVNAKWRWQIFRNLQQLRTRKFKS